MTPETLIKIAKLHNQERYKVTGRSQNILTSKIINILSKEIEQKHLLKTI